LDKNDKADVYNMGMLIFIHQTKPSLITDNTIHSWKSMIEKYTTRLRPETVNDSMTTDAHRNHDYMCLCGKHIGRLCYIEERYQFALLGQVCIGKNKGALNDQLRLALSYVCKGCDKRFSNEAGNKSISMCQRCVNNGVKMNCLKCTKWKKCKGQLCSACSHTWKLCDTHQTSLVSRKVNICSHCIEEKQIEKSRESKERHSMFEHDPLTHRARENNKKRLEAHQKLLEAVAIQEEINAKEKSDAVKAEQDQKILTTTQQCLDCTKRIHIHKFIVRCMECYNKHRNLSAVSQCISCNTKIEPSTWKTKCRSCYLK
jgi:hypothetical protein